MYIRVIDNLEHWKRISGKETLLPADCFSDIKTSKNTLSLWEVDDNISNEDIVKFVIVSTMGRQKPAKVTYVKLLKTELNNYDLFPNTDDPQCSYLTKECYDFKRHHNDLTCIDQNNLIKIAEIIISKIEKAEQDVIVEPKVIEAARELCDKGIVDINKLSDNWKNHLK